MKVLNSKKPVVCVISKISYTPKGYELIEELICLKCAQTFYIYAPPKTTYAKGSCPHCDVPFELTIFLP